MKRTIINLIIIIGIVAVTAFATKRYYPTKIDNTVTDTVRVNVPYEVETIKEIEKPVKVVEYRTDTVEVESVQIERDTVYVQTPGNTYSYSSGFLTSYHTAPKFLGAYKGNMRLSITYMTTGGVVQQKYWNVGNKDYRIGLSGGHPTIQTYKNTDSFSFSHSIQAGYMLSTYSTPYVSYSATAELFSIPVTGTLNINKHPFGTIGVSYQF